MALFDPNDLVTAIHPVTGDPVILPRAVAAQFPTLQLMQPPQVQDPTAQPIPLPPPPPPPPTGSGINRRKHMIGTSPDAPGDEVPYMPAPVAPAAIQPGVGIPQAAMDQAAATVPSTPPPPITKTDLEQQGQAGAYNIQSGALDKQEAAARQQAQAEAEQSRQLGNAYADELQKQDAIDKQRVQYAQAKLNEINQKSAQIDSAINSVSQMKVDNSIAHPLLGAISLALGGIGAALNHSMVNPALNVLNKQIAQNVQVQMANINNARGAVGMQQGQLANMRAQFTDQNALYDAMTAAEIRRAQIQVNQIAQRSNSDIVKAKAQSLIGQLEGQRAQAFSSAVTQQQAADDRQTGFKIQLRGQNIAAGEQAANRAQAASFHADEMGQRNADRKLAYDQLMMQGQRGQAQFLMGQLQTAMQSAVNDANGNPMISPKGQKMIQDANTLDQQAQAMAQQAQQTKDPTQQAALQQQAIGLANQAAMQRVQARAMFTIRTRDEKDAVPFANEKAEAQDTWNKLQELKDQIQNGSLADPANREKMKATFNMLGIELSHQLGARFNENEYEEFTKKVLGGDPTSLGLSTGWRDVTGNLTTRFDQMQKDVESSINTKGRSRLLNFNDPTASLIDHGPQPSQVDATAKQVSADQTPLEEATGERPGVVGRALQSADNDVGKALGFYTPGHVPQWQAATQADLNQPQSVYALKPDQQAAVDKLVKTAQGSGSEAADARRDLLAFAADNQRPALANSVMNVLRDQMPDLYKQALGNAPPEVQVARTAPVSLMNPGTAPTNMVAASAASGDQNALHELVRRATILRDKDAAAALLKIAPGAR